MGADIFMFLQKHLIGFKLRLWLGHSKTFTVLCISHSCCVFRFIVLLEGKPSAHLRFWMLWTGFLLRLSLCLCALSFSSTLMCSSVPAAEKQPHATSTLYFWDGTLTLQRSRIFSELFPGCVAWHKPVSELYGLFFWPQGLVFALICIISCWTFY